MALLEVLHQLLGHGRAATGAVAKRGKVDLGVLVGVAQQVGEDRRHAAEHSGALGLDQLGQRLCLQEAIRHHELRPAERRSVGYSPCVGVEHRHHHERSI
jgi:hypothetical protein